MVFDIKIFALQRLVLCIFFVWYPGRAIFLVSLTHVSLPSRPKPCHKISAHEVSSRLFSCHLSLNALEDQLDRHGRRPCAQRQLLGLKNTTQRNLPRSYWDKLSTTTFSSSWFKQNIVSSPCRLLFRWCIWLGLYGRYRQCQGLNLLGSVMQGTSCNQHARTRAWLLWPVYQFKKLPDRKKFIKCFHNLIFTSLISTGPHGRAMKRSVPNSCIRGYGTKKPARGQRHSCHSRLEAVLCTYPMPLDSRSEFIMYPGLTDAAKEIVLDNSTTANLIQALLPIIFKSKL